MGAAVKFAAWNCSAYNPAATYLAGIRTLPHFSLVVGRGARCGLPTFRALMTERSAAGHDDFVRCADYKI